GVGGGPLDGGPPDADADAGPDADVSPEDPCGFGPTDDPDEDRVVLVAQPFSPDPEVPGTEIRSLILGADGRIADTGTRLDLGSRPGLIAVTPSGRFAIVAGEDGTVTLVEIRAPDDLLIRDVVGLPPLGPADLVMHPDGHTAFVVQHNVDESSGVFTLTLGCDGTLTAAASHFGLRLAEAMALVPGDPDQAVLLGGQTAFEPIDDDDVRLLVRDGDTWRQGAAFDVFHDFVGADGLAIHPAGQLVAIPNNSLFSEETGQVALLALDGAGGLQEVQRVLDLPDPALVRFSPDGSALAVLRPEAGRVTLLARQGADFGVAGELRVGVASGMAFVERGESAGLLVVPGVPAEGEARVQVYRVEDGQGRLVDEAPLGRGFPNVPTTLGLRP
ncbi:MAG: hypothetical protein KC549_07920, partial [Myxococcales bacterium]|nr:hypothetical protein [Myxococcales bacterium]